jgi:hypothetical protein
VIRQNFCLSLTVQTLFAVSDLAGKRAFGGLKKGFMVILDPKTDVHKNVEQAYHCAVYNVQQTFQP